MAASRRRAGARARRLADPAPCRRRAACGWPCALLLDAAPLAARRGAVAGRRAGGRSSPARSSSRSAPGSPSPTATMRETLREPVVFSDAVGAAASLHPSASLSAVRRHRDSSSAARSRRCGRARACLLFEPAAWRAPVRAMAVLAAAVSAHRAWLTVRASRRSAPAARRCARLRPERRAVRRCRAARAVRDADRPWHHRPRRASRRARRAVAGAEPRRRTAAAAAVPIVLVQCESFFDARRLSPLIAARSAAPGSTPAAPAARLRPARRAGLGRQHDARRVRGADRHPGRATLGYDRFNPYHALGAGADRLAGLAAARAGLPDDLPAPVRPPLLPPRSGDAGAGVRDLPRPREPRRLAPAALLQRPRSGAPASSRARRRAGRGLFIFAITMGNHGPVAGRRGPAIDPDLAASFERGRPCRRAANCCAISTACADPTRCCEILIEGLDRRRHGAVLGFYGDHLPSLPRAFAHLGFDEWAATM